MCGCFGFRHRCACYLPKDLKAGARVLIDDGLVEMRADHVSETDIVCTVLNGGRVSNHKGINVPGTKLSMPFISEQDRSDIIFGIENGFDYIAASFTRSAEDILEIRHILKEYECLRPAGQHPQHGAAPGGRAAPASAAGRPRPDGGAPGQRDRALDQHPRQPHPGAGV